MLWEGQIKGQGHSKVGGMSKSCRWIWMKCFYVDRYYVEEEMIHFW